MYIQIANLGLYSLQVGSFFLHIHAKILYTSVFPRPEFVLEFSKLVDRWQSVGQGIWQRKCEVTGRVQQQQSFSTATEDLLRFLGATSLLLSAVKGQDRYSLLQTRELTQELKVRHAQWHPGDVLARAVFSVIS